MTNSGAKRHRAEPHTSNDPGQASTDVPGIQGIGGIMDPGEGGLIVNPPGVGHQGGQGGLGMHEFQAAAGIAPGIGGGGAPFETGASLMRDQRKKNKNINDSIFTGIRIVPTLSPHKLANKRPWLGFVELRKSKMSYFCTLEKLLSLVRKFDVPIAESFNGRWIRTKFKVEDVEFNLVYSLKAISLRVLMGRDKTQQEKEQRMQQLGLLLQVSADIVPPEEIRRRQLEAGEAERGLRLLKETQGNPAGAALFKSVTPTAFVLTDQDDGWIGVDEEFESNDDALIQWYLDSNTSRRTVHDDFDEQSGVSQSASGHEGDEPEVFDVTAAANKAISAAVGVTRPGHLGTLGAEQHGNFDEDDNGLSPVTAVSQYVPAYQEENWGNDNIAIRKLNNSHYMPSWHTQRELAEDKLDQTFARIGNEIGTTVPGSRLPSKQIPMHFKNAGGMGIAQGTVPIYGSGYEGNYMNTGMQQFMGNQNQQLAVGLGQMMDPSQYGYTPPQQEHVHRVHGCHGYGGKQLPYPVVAGSGAAPPPIPPPGGDNWQMQQIVRRLNIVCPIVENNGIDIPPKDFPRTLRTLAEKHGVNKLYLSKYVQNFKITQLIDVQKYIEKRRAYVFAQDTYVMTDDYVERFPRWSLARNWRKDRDKLIAFVLELADNLGATELKKLLVLIHAIWMKVIVQSVSEAHPAEAAKLEPSDETYTRDLKKLCTNTWDIEFLSTQYGRARTLTPKKADQVLRGFERACEAFEGDQASINEGISGEFIVLRDGVRDLLDTVQERPPALGPEESSYRDLKRLTMSALESRLGLSEDLYKWPVGQCIAKILELAFICRFPQLKDAVFDFWPELVQPFKDYPLKMEIGVWHSILVALERMKNSKFLCTHDDFYECPLEMELFYIRDVSTNQAADELTSLRRKLENQNSQSKVDAELNKQKEENAKLAKKLQEQEKGLNNLKKDIKEGKFKAVDPVPVPTFTPAPTSTTSPNPAPAPPIPEPARLDVKTDPTRPIYLGSKEDNIPPNIFNLQRKKPQEYKNRLKDAKDGMKYKFAFRKTNNEWCEVCGPSMEGEYACIYHAFAMCPMDGKNCKAAHPNYKEDLRLQMVSNMERKGVTGAYLKKGLETYVEEIASSKKPHLAEYSGMTLEQMYSKKRTTEYRSEFDIDETIQGFARHTGLKTRLPNAYTEHPVEQKYKDVEAIRKAVNELPTIKNLITNNDAQNKWLRTVIPSFETFMEDSGLKYPGHKYSIGAMEDFLSGSDRSEAPSPVADVSRMMSDSGMSMYSPGKETPTLISLKEWKRNNAPNSTPDEAGKQWEKEETSEHRVYIGRHGPFGNPYKTAEQYEEAFEKDVEYRKKVGNIRNVDTIGCWCDDKTKCHGNVILRWMSYSETEMSVCEEVMARDTSREDISMSVISQDASSESNRDMSVMGSVLSSIGYSISEYGGNSADAVSMSMMSESERSESIPGSNTPNRSCMSDEGDKDKAVCGINAMISAEVFKAKCKELEETDATHMKVNTESDASSNSMHSARSHEGEYSCEEDLFEEARKWVESNKEPVMCIEPEKYVDWCNRMRSELNLAVNHPVYDCSENPLKFKQHKDGFKVEIPPPEKLKLIGGEVTPGGNISCITMKIGNDKVKMHQKGREWLIQGTMMPEEQLKKGNEITIVYEDVELERINQIEIEKIPTLAQISRLRTIIPTTDEGAYSEHEVKQLVQVDAALERSKWIIDAAKMKPGMFAVHGPFGCGKSRVLVSIGRLHKRLTTWNNTACILFMAACNAQVVSLCNRLVKDDDADAVLWIPSGAYQKSGRFDKEAAAYKVSVEAKTALMENGYYGPDWRNIVIELRKLEAKLRGQSRGAGWYVKKGYPLEVEDKVNTMKKKIQDFLIERATYICCTLAIGYKIQQLKDARMAIIDELGQTHDLKLFLGIHKTERVVGAGCHLQLLPNLANQIAIRPILSQLQNSWLHRLAEVSAYSAKLETQYRSEDAIVRLIMEGVYGGNMSSAKQAPSESKHIIDPCTAFVHVERDEVRKPLESEKCMEAGITLYKHFEQHKVPCFIITMHVRQCEAYEKMGIKNVSNLDKLQGIEETVIILDLVTHGDALSGFTRGWRRGCVGPTRAKSSLILVGNRDTVCAKKSIFKFYADLCRMRDTCFEGGAEMIGRMSITDKVANTTITNSGAHKALALSKFDAEITTIKSSDGVEHSRVLSWGVMTEDTKNDGICDTACMEIVNSISPGEKLLIHRWADTPENSKKWSAILVMLIPKLYARGVVCVFFDDTVETDIQKMVPKVENTIVKTAPVAPNEQLRANHMRVSGVPDGMWKGIVPDLDDLKLLPLGTAIPSAPEGCGIYANEEIKMVFGTESSFLYNLSAGIGLSDGARHMDSSRMLRIGNVRIWVGGIKSRVAGNRKWDRVYNCTRNIDLHDEKDIRVPISFREPKNCISSIQEALRDITRSFPQEGDILLHCQVGCDRSVFVLYSIAYFIFRRDLRVELKAIRKEIRDHGGYIFEEIIKGIDMHGNSFMAADMSGITPRKLSIKTVTFNENEQRIISWNIGANGFEKWVKNRKDEIRKVYEKHRPHILFLQECRMKESVVMSTIAEIIETIRDICNIRVFLNPPYTGAIIASAIADDVHITFPDERIMRVVHGSVAWLNIYSPNSGGALVRNDVKARDDFRKEFDKKIMFHRKEAEESGLKVVLIGDFNVHKYESFKPVLVGMPGNLAFEREGLAEYSGGLSDVGDTSDKEQPASTFLSWSFPRWDARLDYAFIDKTIATSGYTVLTDHFAPSAKLGAYDHCPFIFTMLDGNESTGAAGGILKKPDTQVVTTDVQTQPSNGMSTELILPQIEAKCKYIGNDLYGDTEKTIRAEIEQQHTNARDESIEVTCTLKKIVNKTATENEIRQLTERDDVVPKMMSLERKELEVSRAVMEEAENAKRRDTEEKAAKFNAAMAKIEEETCINKLCSEALAIEHPQGVEYQSLMYDDATFGATDSFDCAFKHMKNARQNIISNGKFGRRKIIGGGKAVKLIGGVGIRGTTAVTQERLETFVKSSLIPYYSAELRSRLCALNWCSEIAGAWAGTIQRILGPWSRIESDSAWAEIINDANAITCLRTLMATAQLNPLSPVPEDDVMSGAAVYLARIDGNCMSGCHIVCTIKRTIWDDAEITTKEGFHLRKHMELHVIKAHPWPQSREPPEAGEAEQDAALQYFVETDPEYEHLQPRYTCYDSSTTGNRRAVHHCTEKTQGKRARFLDRCHQKPGVYKVWQKREQLADVDSFGRQDRRYVCQNEIQKMVVGSEFNRMVFPQVRPVPIVDDEYIERWKSVRAAAGKAPDNRNTKRKARVNKGKTGIDLMNAHPEMGQEGVLFETEGGTEDTEPRTTQLEPGLKSVVTEPKADSYVIGDDASVSLIKQSFQGSGKEHANKREYVDYYYIIDGAVARFRNENDTKIRVYRGVGMLNIDGAEAEQFLAERKRGITIEAEPWFRKCRNEDGFVQKVCINTEEFIGAQLRYERIGEHRSLADIRARTIIKIFGAGKRKFAALNEEGKIVCGNMEHIVPWSIRTVEMDGEAKSICLRIFNSGACTENELQAVYNVKKGVAARWTTEVDPSKLPPITGPFEDHLKNMVRFFEGIPIPETKIMIATEEFILAVHQHTGCTRVVAVDQAFELSYFHVLPGAVKKSIDGCPRCLGALDKQEPLTFHSLQTVNNSGLVEVDQFWMYPNSSHLRGNRTIENENFEQFVEANRKCTTHWENTGMFLDERRPFRMITNGRHKTDVVPSATMTAREQMLRYEKSTGIRPETIRTSDTEARGAPVAPFICLKGTQIDSIPAKAKNRATPVIGSKQYLFQTIFLDLNHMALKNSFTLEERLELAVHRTNALYRNGINFDSLTGSNEETELIRKRTVLGLIDEGLGAALISKNLIALAERRNYQKYSALRTQCTDSTDIDPSAERALMRLDESRGYVHAVIAGYALGVYTLLAGNQSYMRAKEGIVWRKQDASQYSWAYLDVYPIMERQSLRDMYGTWSAYIIRVDFDMTKDDFRQKFTKAELTKIIGDPIRVAGVGVKWKVVPVRTSETTVKTPNRLIAIKEKDLAVYEVSVNGLDGCLMLGADGVAGHYIGRNIGKWNIAYPDGTSITTKRTLLWTNGTKGQMILWVEDGRTPEVTEGFGDGGTIAREGEYRSIQSDVMEPAGNSHIFDTETSVRNTIMVKSMTDIEYPAIGIRMMHIMNQMLATARVFHDNGRHADQTDVIEVFTDGIRVCSGELIVMNLSERQMAQWNQYTGEHDEQRIRCHDLLDPRKDIRAEGRRIAKITFPEKKPMYEHVRDLCMYSSGKEWGHPSDDVKLYTAFGPGLRVQVNRKLQQHVGSSTFGIATISSNPIAESINHLERRMREYYELRKQQDKDEDVINHELNPRYKKLDCVHINSTEAPRHTQESLMASAEELEYIGKNKCKPSFSYNTISLYLCDADTEGEEILSPGGGEDVSLFKEGDIVVTLLDSGCESGPIPELVEMISRLTFPRAGLIIHGCVTIPTAARLIKKGWQMVYYNASGEQHRVKGFTGSSCDNAPRVIRGQLGGVDSKTGKVYRFRTMLLYVMPIYNDGCDVTLGNLDLASHEYRMSMKPVHGFTITTTSGKEEISIAKFNADQYLRTLTCTSMVATVGRELENKVNPGITIVKGELRTITIPLGYPIGTMVSIGLETSFRERFELHYVGDTLPSAITWCVDYTACVKLWIRAVRADRRIPATQKDKVAVLITVLEKNGNCMSSERDLAFGNVGDEPEKLPDTGCGNEDDEENLEEMKKWIITKEHMESVIKVGECAMMKKVCPEATDPTILERIHEENAEWWRKMQQGVGSDNSAFRYSIIEKHLSTWCKEQVIEDAKLLDATIPETRMVIALMIASMNQEAFTDEGAINSFFNGYTMGLETLDFNKALGPKQKFKTLHRVEREIRTLLAEREVGARQLEKYNMQEHGILYLEGESGRAPRSDTLMGRIFHAPPANAIAADISCPTIVPSRILSFIQKRDTRIHGANDFNRAFSRIRVSRSLSKWLGTNIGGNSYVPVGGPIGYGPLPACFSLLIFPQYNNLKVHGSQGIELGKEILKEIRRAKIQDFTTDMW